MGGRWRCRILKANKSHDTLVGKLAGATGKAVTTQPNEEESQREGVGDGGHQLLDAAWAERAAMDRSKAQRRSED